MQASNHNSITHITFKTLLITCIAIGMTGCLSFKSQSEKLSAGIQKSYAVSATTANRLSPLILQNSEKYNVPATMIAAVIHQESSFRPHAKSPVGAIGLMQIIPKYWSKSCPGDLYNEAININCGSYILSHYHEKTRNWNKTLGYYNVGPSGYENNRQAKKSGKKYAKSVKQHEKKLKKEM